jgi:hypothetical protein
LNPSRQRRRLNPLFDARARSGHTAYSRKRFDTKMISMQVPTSLMLATIPKGKNRARFH